MARNINNSRTSSGNHHDVEDGAHPNILASCYVVDATTAMLKGFHYSTTGAGGESLSCFEVLPLRQDTDKIII
jgi:hypothetical protein